MVVAVAPMTSQCINIINNLYPPSPYLYLHLHTISSQYYPISCRTASSSILEKARFKSQLNSISSPLVSSDENPFGIFEEKSEKEVGSGLNLRITKKKKKGRVFFLDVNPLCYNGNIPCLRSFAQWISLFFSQVSLSDPVIAVIDGEKGNEYRRQLLPSYKANRRRPTAGKNSAMEGRQKRTVERSHRLVLEVLHNCNVPVVKVEDYEADDVIATLVGQVLTKECSVVIASPDKDFKQLLSDDVQIAMPIPEFNRWSFYTLKHYAAQYNCNPQSDLSMRCIIGDEVDGVPGIQHLVPGFGRKTALKLLRKHGSLENLLNAASVRTVGRQYAQDALTTYADYLRRNFQVLSLNRNVDVQFEEQWMSQRDSQNDSVVLSNFINFLSRAQSHDLQKKLCSNS